MSKIQEFFIKTQNGRTFNFAIKSLQEWPLLYEYTLINNSIPFPIEEVDSSTFMDQYFEQNRTASALSIFQQMVSSLDFLLRPIGDSIMVIENTHDENAELILTIADQRSCLALLSLDSVVCH
jgi:pentatricopeptide repeat protein